MVAIPRSAVKIYVVPADTAPSVLLSTTTAPHGIVTGEITNYNLTGGEADVETVPAFGGFIDKEKPVEQLELSLEIVPKIDTAADAVKWESITKTTETAGGKTVYTLSSSTTNSTQATPKMVVIEATKSGVTMSHLFNNASVTAYELSHAADDNRTVNVTLKFSPTTGAGISNYMSAASAATSFPNWTQLNS